MSPAPRKVAALIINWNGAADTLELIDSLAAQVPEELRPEVWVVDNASAPEDQQVLREGLASRSGGSVHLLCNPVNVGVPAAYNQAIQAAGGDFDYYLRLDNDVVLKGDCLARLADGLERWRDRGVRLVGCNVKFYDNPAEDNGGAVTFHLLRGHTRIAYPERETLCDGVLGCVMLMDREVVRAFAPEVFLGWLFYTTDESEMSLHASTRGWKTLYLPEPLALHKGGRSTRKVSGMATLTSTRNWAFLSTRYAGSGSRSVIVLARLGLTLIGQVVRGRWGVARALVKGAAAACRPSRSSPQLPEVLLDRKGTE